MPKPDIFDRIMSLRLLRPLQPLYRKYKEQLLYLFFGGLTFLLSISVFYLLVNVLRMNELVANVIDWVICVVFAYVTNRTWVFQSAAAGAKGICREAASFGLGRLATLGLEELLLWAGIDLLDLNSLLVKIVAQAAVIIGNYVISKFLVFAGKKRKIE